MFGGVACSTGVNADPSWSDEGAVWVCAAPDGAYGWSNEYFEFDLEKSV